MIFFKESSPVFFVQVDRNHLILHSCEEFTNRSLFSNNSRIDNRHIPTETFCLFEIMSGEYNRNTGFVHFSKKCIHAMAKLKINSCCRFIKNKDHRIMYKGACDHKSSFHTTRKCTCLNILLFPKTESLEIFFSIWSSIFPTNTIISCLSNDDIVDFFKNPKIKLLWNYSDPHSCFCTTLIKIMSRNNYLTRSFCNESRDNSYSG